MNLLKSIKGKFRGKAPNLQEDLQSHDVPENFDGLLDKARDLYYESSSFSISILEEQFGINHITAAKVMEQLEEEGLFEDEDEEDGEWEEIL